MKGQIQFLDPFFKVFFTYRLFKSSAFLPFGTRNQGGKVFLTFSIPLEPLVQKGMMVFPVKSRLSLKVSMLRGSIPHQIDTLGK